MYKSFSVENFRGIHSLKLSELSKVNLLTGLNDASKTSVLEALYLHASGPLAGNVAMRVLLAGRRQEAVGIGTAVGSPWASLFRNLNTEVPGGEKSFSPFTFTLNRGKGA